MRVLITSASGYVAKFVAADLAPDHELMLFSRRHPAEGAKGPSVQAPFVHGDLAALDDCRREAGVQRVVFASSNCALGHFATSQAQMLISTLRGAGDDRGDPEQ